MHRSGKGRWRRLKQPEEEDDGQSPSVEIIEEAEMESKWESNMGASIYNAFIAMDDQRRTYKDDRCRRRARCASCGQIGHWAGDAACHKPSRSPPKKGSKGKRKPKMAYLATAEIRFFTLGGAQPHGPEVDRAGRRARLYGECQS